MPLLSSLKLITLFAIVGLSATTLVHNDWHISAIGFSFYAYLFTAAFLAVWGGAVLLYSKRMGLDYPAPVFLLWGYMLFYSVSGAVQWQTFSQAPLFLSINGLLLLAYCVFTGTGALQGRVLAAGVSLLAAILSAVCLLQYAGMVPSVSPFYAVDGRLANPNLAATFLAMAFPLVLYSTTGAKGYLRWLALLALILLLAALPLLKGRAAFLGVLAGGVCYLFWNTEWFEKFRFSLKSLAAWKVAVAVLVLVSALSGLGIGLYNAKETSSEGRLMIWQISMELGGKRPWFGHGPNTFSREYNLAQAAFFSSGQATPSQVFSSDFIKIAYNDYIQNWVEGGWTGLLLFLGFTGSLLVAPVFIPIRTSERRAAYAGIWAFMVMGMVNSVQYAIPCFALFVLYTSWLCCPSGKTQPGPLSRRMAALIGLFMIVAGVCLLGRLLYMERVSRHLKTAAEYLQRGETQKAVPLLQHIEDILPFSYDYWYWSAMLSYQSKDYQTALQKLEKATKYGSDPAFFLKMGDCYIRLGQTDEAIRAYSLAMYIVPSRLQPKYVLLKTFIARGDTLEATKMAREIVAQKPKGISKNAVFYKKEANDWLNSVQK